MFWHRQPKGPATRMAHLNHRATSRLYVRRGSCVSSAGANPARQRSFQPVAARVAEEVTNLSEPLVQGSLSGDLASLWAVTGVNAEQASKRAMWEPTRLNNGEGRRRWGSERWMHPAIPPG